jgi:hypothetical protein
MTMIDKIDRTASDIADQRGHYAAPCISPDVAADLGKLTPELRQGIKDFLKRKQT